MGTQDKYFGREQGPLGDPQIPAALHVLQKEKKRSQKNHGVLDKYLKMEKEVIKQDKQR